MKSRSFTSRNNSLPEPDRSIYLLTIIKTKLMKKHTYAILTAAIIAAVSYPTIIAKAGPTDGSVTENSLHKGLVLHLTFDQDAPDGKVTDVSGQGNHGKASGVRWTADGKRGGAYEFTADGDE